MKKILITGKNSYVGKSLEKWLENTPDNYSVDSISLRNDSWKEKSFSEYDVVFHAVGIAHMKETKANEILYYRVNRDLAYETAKKAKQDGVKQFIFLSSMSVYGIESGVINGNTSPNPESNYGKSKLQAEELIKPLGDDDFKITIIRPPMIYGKGCKGNYRRLVNLALKVPLFPDIDNQRSMVYIGNFCEFVRLLIDDCSYGVFFPQNSDYVKTSDMVNKICQVHEKKIKLIRVFNYLSLLQKFKITNKVFGNLVYDKEMSVYRKSYQIYDFGESIEKTEL